jgi:hypothetical protein
MTRIQATAMGAHRPYSSVILYSGLLVCNDEKEFDSQIP